MADRPNDPLKTRLWVTLVVLLILLAAVGVSIALLQPDEPGPPTIGVLVCGARVSSFGHSPRLNLTALEHVLN